MNKTIDKLFLDDWANPEIGGRDCIANAIRRLETHLSTLENIIACDGIDARLHQPSAEKPVNEGDEKPEPPVGNELRGA